MFLRCFVVSLNIGKNSPKPGKNHGTADKPIGFGDGFSFWTAKLGGVAPAIWSFPGDEKQENLTVRPLVFRHKNI